MTSVCIKDKNKSDCQHGLNALRLEVFPFSSATHVKRCRQPFFGFRSLVIVFHFHRIKIGMYGVIFVPHCRDLKILSEQMKF